MRRDDIVGGIVLIIIGLLILLSNLFSLNFWFLLSTYWPVILIIIGVWIILCSWRK